MIYAAPFSRCPREQRDGLFFFMVPLPNGNAVDVTVCEHHRKVLEGLYGNPPGDPGWLSTELRQMATAENTNEALKALAAVAREAGTYPESMQARSIEEVGEVICRRIRERADGAGDPHPGERNSMTYPYDPDYVVAPAALLQEWTDERGVTVEEASLHCPVPGYDVGRGLTEVLQRLPLQEAHAKVLHAVTGIQARFWLALEHNYRAGLARGLKDMT